MWGGLCLLGTLLGAGGRVHADGEAIGAVVPFVTLEAEAPAHRTNGRVVRLDKLPGPTDASPELEASGRGFVELSKTGDYLEFPNAPAANALVVRHCIPDAPEGGGTTATLSLYVNGKRRQALTLSSRHNWLYGTGKIAENGQSNTPTPYPHVFWDEARFFIAGGVKAGDTLRLQKDAADTAAFYRVDLIEPEMVPAPLPRPANSLSVADYGAKGQDAATDTAAIQKCVEDARAQGKIVWLPPGTYLQNETFRLEGAQVRGAGMWYTTIEITAGDTPGRFGANGGFQPTGNGASVRDLTLDCPGLTHRGRGPIGFSGTGTHWRIENVWMTHLQVGCWMAGEEGAVTGCRVRMTYADGININNGKTLTCDKIRVENNHVRGTGDDGLAILSHEASPHRSQEVTLRRNTVVASWWGALCDLAGGSGHRIEENLFADGSHSGFVINLPSAYPMYPVTGAVVRKNVLLRCGSNFANQRRGAIWVYPGSTAIRDVLVEQNRITDPIFRGIHLAGSQPQNVRFVGNEIDHPGEDAVVIGRGVAGAAEFTGNQVRRLGADRHALVNDAGDGFQVTATGNSWQTAAPEPPRR